MYTYLFEQFEFVDFKWRKGNKILIFFTFAINTWYFYACQHLYIYIKRTRDEAKECLVITDICRANPKAT